MVNKIEWADDYLIGISEIDQQHQYLFELVNETLAHQELDNVKLSLMKLYKYTREHFNAEEKLMQKIAYPEYQHHKKAHDKLLAQLNETSEAVHDKSLDLNELNHFLTDWLSKHILKADAEIGIFMKQNHITSC